MAKSVLCVRGGQGMKQAEERKITSVHPSLRCLACMNTDEKIQAQAQASDRDLVDHQEKQENQIFPSR